MRSISMVGIKSQWIATLTCSLVILSSVAAVARQQATSRSSTKSDSPAVAIISPTEKRNASLKIEVIRVQLSGDKDIETETLQGLVGARMTSIGMTARGFAANAASNVRSIRAEVREVKDGLVYVDFDYDEAPNSGRDSNPDRQFSTTIALKDGETTLVKSYLWKSKPAQSDSKESSLEQMLYLTVHVMP